MNPLLKLMLARLHAPAGDDGSDTGGTDTSVVDRGDVVDPALTAENLTALVGANDDGNEGETEVDAGASDGGAGETDAAGDQGEQGRQAQAGIPKSRFNQVNQQRKEAEAALELANQELARYRAQEAAAKAPPPNAPAPQAPAAKASMETTEAPFDMEAQEEAYVAALMEGNTKGAVAIRRQINAHLQEEASARATQELNQRQSAQLLSTTAKSVSAAYPWLNEPEGADALELILAARDRKIASGMPAHLALLEAANTIAPKFAPTSADTPSGDLPKNTAAKDTRPAAALARGAADSTAQPPALQVGIGERATATRVNVAQLTEEQFEALTPAEKKRLRGD